MNTNAFLPIIIAQSQLNLYHPVQSVIPLSPKGVAVKGFEFEHLGIVLVSNNDDLISKRMDPSDCLLVWKVYLDLLAGVPVDHEQLVTVIHK